MKIAFWNSVKLLENSVLLFRIDISAVVMDADFMQSILIQTDSDFVSSVFDGIVQQVGEDIFEMEGVNFDSFAMGGEDELDRFVRC